jgi:hypothetical protein
MAPPLRLFQSPSLSFGPNELCTLRQYLLSVKQEIVPVECFFEILETSGNDWILFSQLLWKFRSTILSLVGKQQPEENARASQLSLAFIQRSVGAFQTFVPTSFQEYFFHRWRLLVFLFSLPTAAHFPSDPFLLHGVFCLLTLHPDPAPDSSLLMETSLIDSHLVLRTSAVARHFRRSIPGVSTGSSTEISQHICLHSPLELALLAKCFALLSAEDEFTQLHSLIQTSLRPLTDPSSFTSLYPTSRTRKQDRRRWRKFCRKYQLLGQQEMVTSKVIIQ